MTRKSTQTSPYSDKQLKHPGRTQRDLDATPRGDVLVWAYLGVLVAVFLAGWWLKGWVG